MARILAPLLLLALSACVPAPQAAYPENRSTPACFSGAQVLMLDVAVPARYGRVLALTQHARDAAGLRSVCALVVNRTPDARGAYPIYAGEIDNGRDELCVSARTANAGHVLSCAPASAVRAAMRAPAGSPGNTIRLADWVPFPGGA